MESKNTQSFNTETNKPSHDGHNATATDESKSTEVDWATRNRESKADCSKDFSDRNAEFYDQTKKTVSDTFNKGTGALNKTYDQAMAFSRENPGTSVLIAFGGGLIAGLLLAIASRNRRRQNNIYSSYAEPVVNTLSQMASDFFRRR